MKGVLRGSNFLEFADCTPFIYIHKAHTVTGRLMYSTVHSVHNMWDVGSLTGLRFSSPSGIWLFFLMEPRTTFDSVLSHQVPNQMFWRPYPSSLHLWTNFMLEIGCSQNYYDSQLRLFVITCKLVNFKKLHIITSLEVSRKCGKKSRDYLLLVTNPCKK